MVQAAASYRPHWETEAYPDESSSSEGAVAEATGALGRLSLFSPATPPAASTGDAASSQRPPSSSQRGGAGAVARRGATDTSEVEAPFPWRQEEQDALAELGKRVAPPPVSGAELTRRLCGLVDILVAYAYDWRMTQVGRASSTRWLRPRATHPRLSAGGPQRGERMDDEHPEPHPVLAGVGRHCSRRVGGQVRLRAWPHGVGVRWRSCRPLLPNCTPYKLRPSPASGALHRILTSAPSQPPAARSATRRGSSAAAAPASSARCCM